MTPRWWFLQLSRDLLSDFVPLLSERVTPCSDDTKYSRSNNDDDADDDDDDDDESHLSWLYLSQW